MTSHDPISLSPEISLLFRILYRNTLGDALTAGSSQIKEVRKFSTRCSEKSKHHSSVFSKFLYKCHGSTPVSTTTDPAFSDKLLALMDAGMVYDGLSLSGSPSRDSGAAYSRLIIEVGKTSTSSRKHHNWMGKSPSAPDRKDLAKG